MMYCLLATVFMACNSSKKLNPVETQKPDMKAYLIDGNWESNFIMNTPKAFDDLFKKSKPNIQFNTKDGKVTGMSGCNMFNGNFAIDGKNINFSDDMAVTKKMCPDMSGEQLFYETLKKVNNYSVTDNGNTLNLIMGDIAVMRLKRIE